MCLSDETFAKVLNNLSVVFTHWSYDKKSIKKRRQKGITREMRINQINGELTSAFAKHYNISNQVPCFFIDNETLDDDDCDDNEKIQVARELENYFKSINNEQQFVAFKIMLKPHTINQSGSDYETGWGGSQTQTSDENDNECITKRCLIALVILFLVLVIVFLIVYFVSN